IPCTPTRSYNPVFPRATPRCREQRRSAKNDQFALTKANTPRTRHRVLHFAWSSAAKIGPSAQLRQRTDVSHVNNRFGPFWSQFFAARPPRKRENSPAVNAAGPFHQGRPLDSGSLDGYLYSVDVNKLAVSIGGTNVENARRTGT